MKIKEFLMQKPLFISILSVHDPYIIYIDDKDHYSYDGIELEKNSDQYNEFYNSIIADYIKISEIVGCNPLKITKTSFINKKNFKENLKEIDIKWEISDALYLNLKTKEENIISFDISTLNDVLVDFLISLDLSFTSINKIIKYFKYYNLKNQCKEKEKSLEKLILKENIIEREFLTFYKSKSLELFQFGRKIKKDISLSIYKEKDILYFDFTLKKTRKKEILDEFKTKDFNFCMDVSNFNNDYIDTAVSNIKKSELIKKSKVLIE